MRETNDLSYRELQRIVESIQSFLYIDRDDDGRQIWNPDKQWRAIIVAALRRLLGEPIGAFGFDRGNVFSCTWEPQCLHGDRLL